MTPVRQQARSLANRCARDNRARAPSPVPHRRTAQCPAALADTAVRPKSDR